MSNIDPRDATDESAPERKRTRAERDLLTIMWGMFGLAFFVFLTGVGVQNNYDDPTGTFILAAASFGAGMQVLVLYLVARIIVTGITRKDTDA